MTHMHKTVLHTNQIMGQLLSLQCETWRQMHSTPNAGLLVWTRLDWLTSEPVKIVGHARFHSAPKSLMSVCIHMAHVAYTAINSFFLSMYLLQWICEWLIRLLLLKGWRQTGGEMRVTCECHNCNKRLQGTLWENMHWRTLLYFHINSNEIAHRFDRC